MQITTTNLSHILAATLLLVAMSVRSVHDTDLTKLTRALEMLAEEVVETSKTVIEKPKNETNGEFFKSLLHLTALDQEIESSQLPIYVNTIKELVLHHPEVLDETIDSTDAKKYALYHCYPEISKVLYKKIEDYSKAAPKKENPAAPELIKQGTQKLTNFVTTLKEYNEKTEDIIAAGKTFSLSLKSPPSKKSEEYPYLNAYIICSLDEKIGNNEPTNRGLIDFDYNDICGNRLYIDIKTILIPKQYQGMGLGHILMETIINFAKTMIKKIGCNDAHIYLSASPEKPELLGPLINFYKVLGFVPNGMDNRMSMYIDKNGRILKKYEFKDGWQDDWKYDRQRCKVTSKK